MILFQTSLANHCRLIDQLAKPALGWTNKSTIQSIVWTGLAEGGWMLPVYAELSHPLVSVSLEEVSRVEAHVVLPLKRNWCERLHLISQRCGSRVQAISISAVNGF